MQSGDSFIINLVYAREMLKLGRNLVHVDIRTLMMIDSLEMTELDRELIAEHCADAKEDRIIITTWHRYHGGNCENARRKNKE